MFSKQRVCECPGDAFGEAEASEKVFVIKIDKHIESLGLDEVKNLKDRLCKTLRIKLRLLHIDKGCVKLTCRAHDIEMVNITEEQKQVVGQLGILSISYGQEVLFTSGLVKTIDDSKMPSECPISDFILNFFTSALLCIAIENDSDSGFVSSGSHSRESYHTKG